MVELQPSSSANEPLVVVVGPTASGKTGLAIELARALHGEVVCADSVQVYRGMDIGSGKATAEELAQAPHHCLDLADPDEPFDAARFREAAAHAIDDIRARGRRVILAGGTGLYIRALLYGLSPAPPVDPEVRARLEREADERSLPAMHRRLAEVDPVLAERLGPRDRPRVLRGLEVFETGGVPLSELQRAHGFAKPLYDTVTLGIRWSREVLRERIALRSRQMVDQGFLDEVRALRARGYGSDLKVMQALGYRHMGQVLDGELDVEEALRLQIRDTQRYARRQMTWFKALDGVHWLGAPFDPAEAVAWARARLGIPGAVVAGSSAPTSAATGRTP